MVLVSFVNTPMDVQVFGAGDVLLGTTTVNVTGVNGTFLGIVADDPITRIEINEAEVFQIELIYELSFGTCSGFTRAIPTLSEWGLIAMAGILGIIGLIAIRRRKAVI